MGYNLFNDVLVQVPLARSETYLSELLEEVCNSMSDYALYVDPHTQDKRYARFAPRDNGGTESFPDIQNFQFDGMDSSGALKFAVSQVIKSINFLSSMEATICPFIQIPKKSL